MSFGQNRTSPVQDSDTIWSSQQELPCPYPELPIVPHSIFNNDHLSFGLIDKNRLATYHYSREHSRQVYQHNDVESNASSPRWPGQQHWNSDVNQAEKHKRPSTGSDERKRRRNKRRRLEETTLSPAGNSCASLSFHFLSSLNRRQHPTIKEDRQHPGPEASPLGSVSKGCRRCG